MAKNYFRLFFALGLTCIAPGASGQVSSGTAFAVAPGLLVTNQHVVDGCSAIEVLASDGRRNGAVVDSDALIDLALVRVTGLKGATARLRNPRSVRLGESVLVFGFPLAGSLTSGGNFTSGLVSGLRGLRDAAGELQITAPVQPGNSGGPLMDASGLVIGVVQSKLDAIQAAKATGDIPQNVNFAISLDVLAEFLAKNKVAFRDGAISAPLNTSRVAELAQSFTYRVECRGKVQQAGGSPTTKGKPPMATSSGGTFKDCNDCPEMVMIAAGTFLMGSANSRRAPDEQPQHSVSIKAFSLSKFEITQEQWFAVMGDQPSKFKGRRLPVERVSWNDAQAFVKKLSEKTGKNYRLPSEAEWEYTARAGQTNYSISISENENELDRYAWFKGNSGYQTHPVGEKLPNAWGLYDMHGNVWEWIEDCSHDDYIGAPSDGTAWTAGPCDRRVLRGGSWFGDPLFLSFVYRFSGKVADRLEVTGLRVARTD